MSEGFGARLRQRREEQQIVLNTISEQTKIKLSLLEALERDDLSHWPLGLFGRSYVRSYAQAIGLDPAATLREFLERHPGSTGAVADPLSEVDRQREERAGRMESLFLDDEDGTLSASTASALHPLTDVRRDYLVVLGILAASVFISLRKRPHRAAARIR